MYVHQNLDVKTAAERLGISRAMLYLIMDRGELPFEKIGTRRLIDESDLIAFKDRCRSAPRLETAALR